MQLSDYIHQKQRAYYSSKAAKVGGIRERWEGRIEANGWHKQGENGAAKYLVQYGKSIKLPKVLALAHYAEQEGCPDVADGFYLYAARLEGVAIDRRMASGFNALAHRMEKMPKVALFDEYADFPALLQPGKVKFLDSGNPDLVGTELVAFVAKNEMYFQFREEQDTLHNALQFNVDECLRMIASALGTMVLRCELAYVDFASEVHATAEEVINANLALGFETIIPEPLLTIVDCLYCSTKGADIGNIEALTGKEFVVVRSKENA